MAEITIEELVSLDYGAVRDYLLGFLADQVRAAGREGYVVGLSGGVDSSTAFKLAVESLGPGRVTALIMPDPRVTPEGDVEDARGLAESEGVEYHEVDIGPILDSYLASIPVHRPGGEDRVAVGNLRARIRMSILYYYANKLGRMVLGTGDRSEILIGYYTKYGDGGVDVLPLSVLYKSQVRRLALELGLPERIAYKPSSPRLWKGQMAEEELGISYEEIDLVLYAVFDKRLSVEEASRATGVEAWKARRVIELHEASQHKRSPPASPDYRVIQRLYTR